jgi:Kef-type K+ transport system membrane component KefB
VRECPIFDHYRKFIDGNTFANSPGMYQSVVDLDKKENQKEQDQSETKSLRTSGTSLWGPAAYGGLLLGAIAFFFVIQGFGESLVAPTASAHVAGSGSAKGGSSEILFHLLVALTVVVVAGRLLGRLFGFIGQPQVIGEVIGGILLGPSLLGQVSPEAYAYILPASIAPFLGMVAQLGVILYMFLVGLELDPDHLRGQLKATIATAHVGIVLPFMLGSALSLYLYPRFSTSDVSFTNFALFLGVAMSITAFPVLARILSDRGMIRTKLGAIALTCSAVGDVTAWCLLAFIVGVVQAKAESALMVTLLTLGFIGFMFVAVRPLTARMARAWDRNPTQGGIAFALVGVLVAAMTTEAIGIHAVFGAFLLGAVIPHDSALGRSLKDSLENVVTILLLPAFFAFTGMRTQIGLVSSGYEWAICGLIIVVAVAGKFGGTLIAARATGLGWRDAAGLGVLMNTRGLMELIVLNIGLDLGVISPTLFTMMVLMALTTTLATTPVLQQLLPQAMLARRRGAVTARVPALARVADPTV